MVDVTALIAFQDAKPAEQKGQDKADQQTPSLLPIFIMIGVMFYLMVFLPGRKEKQKRQELLNALKKNDEVVTNSGIIGIVTGISDKADEVTIRSDETRLRILRSSIARIVNAKEEAAKEPAKDQPKEQPKA